MARTIVRLYGIVFVVVGIIGFFNDPVFGLFEVDTAHNLVHLVSGLLALIMSRSEGGARTYAKLFGIVYGVVTVWGFLNGSGQVLGMDTNGADNILHLILTLPLLYVGFMGRSRPAIEAM
ncbi:MAG: DUF4383 domain-containing protein [Candidatus Yanofskybacteria bacterium]|nr:DUF4383 domain-containing protein [Candidatus Yanofskybacteria bacterium]